MADRRVKIVNIQIDTTQALKTLGDYAIAIENAQARQKQLQREYKNGSIGLKEYKMQMGMAKEQVKEAQAATYRLSQQLQNQNNSMKAQEGSIRQLKTELRAATLAYENMSRAERESSTGTQLKAHLAELKKELTAANLEATNMYKNMGDTSKVESGLSSMTRKVKEYATQLAAIATGGGIVRLGQSAIDLGRKFYDGMAQVKAVTQATDGEMTKLTDTARELGRTTKFHATDAAKAMENLSRGGFNTNEVLMSINTTLKMAQANAIDLDTSSDVLIRTLRGFRMPVDEKSVNRVADVVSQASRKSATNVTEMAMAFKNASPMAGALNIPIEQVAAALGVLADNGTRGADAGTAMRMTLLGLSDPTSKAGKVFKELGITIDEVELKNKGLVGVLEELSNSGILKDPQSLHKLGTIFGRRVTPAVVGLINNFDRYKQKLTEVENAQGVAAQMFKDSLDPASNALYTLSSAWEDFKIGLYNFNSPGLKSFAETLTSIVQFMTANIPTIASVVFNLIASFSLTKVAQSAIASVNQIKDSIIINAEKASAAVQISQNKELLIRRQIATLTAECEQLKTDSTEAGVKRRDLVQTQLATREAQLASTSANTKKLKEAEATAWSEAQAIKTGSAWARGMAIAKTAFIGFGKAVGAVMKSTLIMAGISLAIEGVSKLVSYLGKLKSPLIDLDKSHNKVAADIQAQNDKITKSGDEAAAQGIANIKMLRNAARNINRPLEERQAAIRKLMSIVPEYQAQILKSGRLYEKNADAVDKYIQKLRDLARAEAAKSLYVENEKKILKAQATIEDARQKKKNVQDRLSDAGYSRDAKVMTTTKQVGFGEGSDVIRTNTTTNAKGQTVEIKGKELEDVKRRAGFISKFNNRIEAAQDVVDQMTNQNRVLDRVISQSVDSANKNTPKGKKKTNVAETITRDNTGEDDKEAEKAARKREAAANKAARIAETEASKEQKAIKALHDAMEATMLETIEKRRISITNQYTDEINKLKSRLDTERNLTAKAKDAINETIKYKQIKMQQELAKLSDESLKEELAREQKYVASRLSVTQKGSQEELNLKKQQIENQRKQSQLDLNTEEKTAKQGATDKVDTAKTNMDAAKAKLDADKENGADDKTIATDLAEYQQRVAQYAHMQNELTTITEQYNQRRADINEKARQDELIADQNFENQKEANRQMAAQTAITEMEASLLQDQDYQDRKRAIQQLGIDVTTQEEMNQLQAERDNAQQHLDFITKQGQLEGETQEQFMQRQAEAKLALAQKDAAINDAEVKNEQAKQKAFESVGNSLISIFDAVGESNTALAKVGKVIALAQIAIDTGKAIAAMTAAEAGKGIVGIATTAAGIASILANIATAISTVKSAKFATGGKVVGPGTGTSDSIPAQLSNGEYVMTAKATRMFEPLLAAMNGIGAGVPIASSRNYSVIQNTNDMTDSFTEAAQEIKPVVSVVEITDAQNRVETIQNIDNV